MTQVKHTESVSNTVQIRVYKETRDQARVGAAVMNIPQAEFLRRAVARELAYNSGKKAK